MDGVEPKLFFACRIFAEPRFEKIVGRLPVAPNASGFFNCASVCAKIIDIKWF